MLAIADSETIATDLAQSVHSQTYGSIRDLEIDLFEGHVVVTGRCRTYHQKQLVTHAVLSAEPSFTLQNEVVVC